MARSGTNGPPMQTYRTPKSAARKARALRREDKRWAAQASPVEVVYACICARNPAACRAALHTTDQP